MITFRKIFNIGLSKVINAREKKRIKILNLAVIISIFHALFFLGIDFVLGTLNIQRSITLNLEILFFSSILFFQYKALFKLAKLFFTITVFVNLFYHCNYAFKGYYGEYQYIVIPLFSLFLFDKWYMHYGLLVASIIAFYVPNMYYNIYPNQYFGYLNVLLLFIGVFLIVNFFKRLNHKNEKLLEIERNKVIEDKLILEKQQEELNKLNDFKTHFFVNISHEIRTPITLIKGYASRINITENDTDSLESLNIIKTQTQNIQDIVNDILDLSKLEVSELEINKEPLHLLDFIKKIQLDFSDVFKKKDIYFKVDTININSIIKIDENLFRKSINNLINNALKFTPKKGEVILKIIANNDILEISITDNGIGIPEYDIDKVFDRFYQSKNDITASQGSGIGLAFAKSIVEAHGFKLSVDSIPNFKTTFKITIPSSCFMLLDDIKINKEQDLTNVVTSNNILNKTSEYKSKNILIVEDHDEMRGYLKIILKDYTIIEAKNGEEGLIQLQKYKFDTIITDYMMPVMDGITFVNEIKNRAIKTPILVITARNDDSGKLNMLRLGIDAYITKPFLEEELLFNIKKSMLYYSEIEKFQDGILENEKTYLENEESLFYKELKTIIENNYQNKNFGVDDVAHKLHLSRSSLFRKTKLFLGQTPNEVIGEVRFQKAKELLTDNPKIKKKDLAEAVGIYNATYFFKKLNERFGIKT